jgi:hypothetical protein
MNITVRKPLQAQAWRIEFADRQPKNAAPLIRQPRSAWLCAREANTSEVLEDTAPPARAGSGLSFVYLPAGCGTPYEVQKQAETWMASRTGEESGILEVQFRNERLLWRRGRAICFGSTQAMEEVFTAVTRFSFCEGELARLERQIQDCWVTLEKDTELTKRLSSRNLERQAHIDAMARTVTAMRVAQVRLQVALETPPSDIAAPARRLFLELALQADTDNRLEMADDSIEVLQDFYTHMREQFSEFRHFVSEYRVTLLILFVLLGDALLSIDKIKPWMTSIAGWVSAFHG